MSLGDRPSQLEQSIALFVEYCNNRRCHKSPNNLTPANAYVGKLQVCVSKTLSGLVSIAEQTHGLNKANVNRLRPSSCVHSFPGKDLVAMGQ